MVSGVDELVAQCAAALALVEPVVEEYGSARLVPCAAQSIRQRLLDNMDAIVFGAISERIDVVRAEDVRVPDAVDVHADRLR